MAAPHRRWIRWLLRLYPRDYRQRYGRELSDAMAACAEIERPAGRSAIGILVVLATDALRASLHVRSDARRRSGQLRIAGNRQGDSTMQSIVYPLLPVSNVKTLNDVLSESTASERFNASLLGAFAGAALLLAAIGVAGVLAISVARRTSEIGIRLALGARSSDVLAMVLRQGLTLVLLGLAIGLPSSFFVSRLLSTLLFGVGPHDPIAF